MNQLDDTPVLRPMRVGAIDVGTNSIRLVVAEAEPDGRYRVIDDEKVMTRLGAGLNESGLIERAAMDASIEAIGRFKGIALGYDVDALRAVATSAVREASNGDEMIKRVWTEGGLHLEVIDGDDEARLAYKSVAHIFDLSSMNAAVVDIGGGSTEIVVSTAGAIETVVSLPVGAVRLSEAFPAADKDDEQFSAMKKFVRNELREAMPRPKAPLQVAFGTGGTFTNLGRVALCQDKGLTSLDASVRGYELDRGRLRHIIEWFRKLDRDERADVPGLTPGRADIIIPGVVIVERVMKHIGVNWLRVHDRGIRDGLIIDMLEDLFHRDGRYGAPRLTRREAAMRFGVSCRYEEAHCVHVTDLALSIYDQLIDLGLIARDDPRLDEDRELLEAAGLLHDIGYIVNYSKHHKHSYHIIRHSDLAGFTSRQLEIVANVARYHRRAEPKHKHEEFARLNPEDRERVRRLSAILRIADGLDRTHMQLISSIHLRREGDAIVFAACSLEDPAVNLWGAERKAALFRDAFGLEPRFQWLGEEESARIESERAPEQSATIEPLPLRESQS